MLFTNHYIIEDLDLPSTTQPKCSQHSICHKENSIQVLETSTQATITFEPYHKTNNVNMKILGIQEKYKLTKNNLRCPIMPSRDNIVMILVLVGCATKINNLNST